MPGRMWFVALSASMILNLGHTLASPEVLWLRPQTGTSTWSLEVVVGTTLIPTTRLEKWPSSWEAGAQHPLPPGLFREL